MMPEWKNPPDATPKSTRFICPERGQTVYYQQPNRLKYGEAGKRRCGYVFCPWCRKRIGGDHDG